MHYTYYTNTLTLRYIPTKPYLQNFKLFYKTNNHLLSCYTLEQIFVCYLVDGCLWKMTTHFFEITRLWIGYSRANAKFVATCTKWHNDFGVWFSYQILEINFPLLLLFYKKKSNKINNQRKCISKNLVFFIGKSNYIKKKRVYTMYTNKK